MIIELSAHWRLRAREAGRGRQDYADGAGLRQYGNILDGGVDEHIVGALGEIAVAKLLRRRWVPQVGTLRGVDVDGVVEVRTRRLPGFGDLAIRPDDKNDKPYVLVHVNVQTEVIDIVGWLYGEEAKGKGPWCEARLVWFVPPPYRAVEELVRLFGRQA